MGTSSNHRSRAIPPWLPARAILGRPDVTTEAQSREIWRAALGDERALLRERLSGQVMQYAREIAKGASTPAGAASNFDTFLLSNSSASLFDSIARRALVRAVANATGANGFGGELFAETAAYLASRDLPSYVGATGRVETVNQAIKIKVELQQRARLAATSASLQTTSPSKWPEYVARVLAMLTSRAS